ncbi:MAG: hypothetical protein ACQEV7_15155 [Bacillota bacterium]
MKENQLVPAKELYGDEFSNMIGGFNSMVQGLKERNETNRLLLEKGMSTSRALSILQSGKGTQWDPQFVEFFLAIMKESEEKVPIASSI